MTLAEMARPRAARHRREPVPGVLQVMLLILATAASGGVTAGMGLVWATAPGVGADAEFGRFLGFLGFAVGGIVTVLLMGRLVRVVDRRFEATEPRKD